MRTVTYNFPWHRTSKEAKSKCVKCGKTIKRTFSIEYNHLGPSEKNLQWLNKRVEDFEAEEHICTKCQKNAIKQAANDITESLQDDFKELNKIYEEHSEMERQLFEKQKVVLNRLSKKLKGTICTDGSKEYLIDRVGSSFISSTPIFIEASGICKREPWCTSETDYYIVNKKGWRNGVDVNKITFTDETLKSRQELREKFCKKD